MGLTALYIKQLPCRNFMYKYILLSNNSVEIIYYNRRSGLKRRYLLTIEYPLTKELIDEAVVIAENLYTIIFDRAAKPNIPLYALIIVLLKKYRGLSYKCKIAREKCPMRIHKLFDGVRVEMSCASIIEQVYRVMKKYSSL